MIAMLFAAPADTATVAASLLPPADAVIVACPTSAPVTTPLDDTAAIVALEVDHANDCPEITFPDASFAVAVSCCVAPAVMLAEPGLIETLFTEPTETVSAAVPLLPPAAAVMVAPPDCPAVTMPPDDTAPTDGSELDHAIV